MQGRQSAIRIVMNDHTRMTLTGWLRKQKTPVALAKRARVMLMLADGHTFSATARHVELRERHVRKWALRFVAHGIDGLSDKTRPGRKPVFSPEVAMYVVKLACERPDIVGRSLSDRVPPACGSFRSLQIRENTPSRPRPDCAVFSSFHMGLQ